MLDLKNFIKESLVNEAETEYMFVWSHFEPADMYCVSGKVDTLVKEMGNYDWNYEIVTSSSKLHAIAWNDEYLIHCDVPGNNLNDAKRKEEDYIQSQLDSQRDQIEQENYVYIESNLFAGAGEWDDAKPNDKAKKYLNRFIKMIDNSYVDGDSSCARKVLDIRKGEVLLGSESANVTFMTVDEFKEQMFGEE